MPTTFANTIDGNDIYAARAVADKDGNQLDTTYAKSASLSTVATSGDYDDLSNKPSIPAAQVNSDWNASSGVAEILNKPTILPYKPVVAGTGVRIVDDTQNNRVVVEADETVLWTGSINTTSPTAPLSEVTSNFEKIKVYIQANGYNVQSTLVHELVLNYRSDFSNDAVAFVQVSEIHSSITTQCTLYLHFTGAYGTGLKLEAGSRWVGSTLTEGITTYPCNLVKVVGVNRVAST